MTTLPLATLPVQGAPGEKTFTVQIADRAGNPLGIWADAPLFRVRQGPGGGADLSLTLPRDFGRLDEPGEPGGRGTLAWGNRVRVAVSNPRVPRLVAPAAAVGFARVGEAAVGVPANLDRVVWSGTIEQWAPTPPSGVTVTCMPRARLLGQTVLDAAFARSGDPVALARQLVEWYAPGLSWDGRNPTASGEHAAVSFPAGHLLEDALTALRDLCGPRWRLTVTPADTVRLVPPPDPTIAPDHLLMPGVVADVSLERSTHTRAKRVLVRYATGIEEARASDYLASDPRTVVFEAAHLTSAADAARLARLHLQALDRVRVRAACTVLGEAYDLERLAVGDSVRLVVERPISLHRPPTGQVGMAPVGEAAVGVGGPYDGGALTLSIAALDYELHQCRLELEEPQPTLTDAIMSLSKRLSDHLAHG